jgi:general secretion pathway protein G
MGSNYPTLTAIFGVMSPTASGIAVMLMFHASVCPDGHPINTEAARTSAGILSTLARVHREQTGFLPESVADLQDIGRFEGTPLDPWGRPFLYWVVENEPVFISLGFDGKCGGQWINADIASDGYELKDGECEVRTTTCHTLSSAPRGWWHHSR